MSLRERKKQQTRTAIVDAATDLINRHGYDDANMRDIAEAANVSYQTLYNYFPTKALILSAILRRDYVDSTAAVQAALKRSEGSLLDVLNTALKLQFDAVAHRDRELWREVFVESMKTSAGIGPWLSLKSSSLVRLAEILEHAQETRVLDPYVDTQVLAKTLTAVGDHAFMLYVTAPSVSKVEFLRDIREQMKLIVTPYLRDAQ